MLRLRWRAQVHAVAGARLHQRIGERRAPADVAAVESTSSMPTIETTCSRRRVLVGHGCAEEDAVAADPERGAAGSTTTAGQCVREKANPRIDLANRRLRKVVGVSLRSRY